MRRTRYLVQVWRPEYRAFRAPARNPEEAARAGLPHARGGRSAITVTDDRGGIPRSVTFLTFDGAGLSRVEGMVCS